jgi:coenzyme F420-reducing hydrogenase alpha subunit
MTRLIVDPLTRVEGHGRVELLLKGGQLEDVHVRLLESPRLFEALVVGRQYSEVPDLICRICAICSAVHKVTSLRALENAMAVAVPPIAAMLRELLVLGGHLQSHALHLFCLILPDLRCAADVIALLRQKDPLAKSGMELKAFGNRIQEVVGGRVVHPINPILGGMSYRPKTEALNSLAEEAKRWQQSWPLLANNFLQTGNYPHASPALGSAIATGHNERFALDGGGVWHEGEGELPATSYARLLMEQSRSDSYAKDAAGERGPFLTGALARARLAAQRGLPVSVPEEDSGIHANNAAQVNEIGWALQRVGQLLDALLIAGEAEPHQATHKLCGGGTGTALMEAPRGLLVHHYVVDEWGTVVAADIVTPTAINQRVMQKQIMADLAGEDDPMRLQEVTERIIRAYDPCISCAVHLVSSDKVEQVVFSARLGGR